MDHGVSLEHSQHRGASTVKQRLLSSSMFCSHQHIGSIAACRLHLNGVLPFSVLTKDWKDKALIVLLVFSYFLFPFSRVSFSISFFSNLRHHIPSVRHYFLFRQMPRLLFMITGFSMNGLQGIPSLRVQIECVSFVLLRPSEWATVVLGAWGVNGCIVKHFHRNSTFKYGMGICRASIHRR